MFPINVNNSVRAPLPDLRQTDNMSDRYDSNLNGNYRYQTLINASMSSSDNSLNVEKSGDEKHTFKTYLEPGQLNRLVKSTSDQKLPEGHTPRNSFYYVNKNGHTVESKVSPPSSRPATKINENHFDSLKPNATNEMLCNHFLVELANSENNKNAYNHLENKYEPLKHSIGRSVPSMDTANGAGSNSFNDSTNSSLVHRENNGELVINTSLTIQEPNIEITSDHIKYINLFSILCCWCFPITGIIGIVFARLTEKYYKLRDLNKAKKYLKRSEWMLIATFFFGFTLIAIGFAIMEHFLFKSKPIRSSHFF
jgi:hypothetical protein